MGINGDVEVIKFLCFSNLVQLLMESYHLVVIVTWCLPVIVDTIKAKVLQHVNHGLCILKRAVIILGFQYRQPASGIDTTYVARGIEELNTTHDVGSVLMCSIGPRTRSLEQAVVPCAEEVGVVPHGEVV